MACGTGKMPTFWRCRRRRRIANALSRSWNRTTFASTAIEMRPSPSLGSHPPWPTSAASTWAGRFYNWDDQRESRRVAFLGNDASKELFPGRNPGETVYPNAFPYEVVATGDQETGLQLRWLDVNRIFIPFAAMRRDFPDKPPGPPIRPAAGYAPVGRAARGLQTSRSTSCPGECITSTRRTKKPVLSGILCKSQSISPDDRRHEVLSGRGGNRDLVAGRTGRDERHDGCGTGAYARDRSSQSARRTAGPS